LGCRSWRPSHSVGARSTCLTGRPRLTQGLRTLL